MKNNRKSCGSQNKCSCKSSNQCNNTVKPIEQCNEYKQCANKKCEEAESLNNRANKLAQEALAAEKRAECLKQQAIEECQRANELWDQYNKCAKQGVLLMQQAEVYLAKSSECYANLYSEVEGCDLSCFGYNKCVKDECNSGCNCGCNSNCGCSSNCGCGCGC